MKGDRVAKTRRPVENAKDDSAVVGRLAKELIATVKEQTAQDRIWFPNGIDSLTINVSVSAQGANLSLSIAGPKSAGIAGATAALSLLAAGEQRVMDASKEAGKIPANLADCNKFVKDVASRVGITIDPNANADRIVDIIGTGPWTPLPVGDNAAAMSKAAEGKLVVAGMKASEFTTPHSNGHVAVVHGHEVAGHPGFPHASWGSLNGSGPSAGTVDGSIRNSFPVKDLSKIHYGFRDL